MYDSAIAFGDTSYLFGDPAQPIEEQARNLALKVASLFHVGLFISRTPFLLRAGIATGDLRTEVVDTQQGPVPVHMGTALEIGRAHV